MAKNKAVLGLYRSREAAEDGVDRLRTEGFSRENVSMLLPEDFGSQDLAHEKSSKAPEGATAGAGSGAVIGGTLGWLVGVGTLAIPGLGPLIAAGPIVGMLAGAGAGGAAGGILGGLIGMGIPEYEAKLYEGRIREGGILISVHCEDSEEVKRAKKILDQSGAEDISTVSEEKGRDAASRKPKDLRASVPANQTIARVPLGENRPARIRPADQEPPGRRERPLVSHIMTAGVEIIDASASLDEAARTMRDFDVGFLPVRSGDRIVGVITDRDIATRAASAGQDLSDTRVRTVMTEGYLACLADQPVSDAARIMETEGTRRLLVVDSDGWLVGVLSVEDIAAKTADSELASRVLKRQAAAT